MRFSKYAATILCGCILLSAVACKPSSDLTEAIKQRATL